MNPFEWERQQQVALIAAVVFGCVVGIGTGIYETPQDVSFDWGDLWCDQPHCLTKAGYDSLILLWTILGGLIGGATVYLRQILRRPANR